MQRPSFGLGAGFSGGPLAPAPSPARRKRNPSPFPNPPNGYRAASLISSAGGGQEATTRKERENPDRVLKKLNRATGARADPPDSGGWGVWCGGFRGRRGGRVERPTGCKPVGEEGAIPSASKPAKETKPRARPPRPVKPLRGHHRRARLCSWAGGRDYCLA